MLRFVTSLLLLSLVEAFLSRSCTDWNLRHSLRQAFVDDVINAATRDDMKDEGVSVKVPHLVFPGGGLFFYWQAGAVSYLREQGYNMEQITASGASAGALTATLLATNVDFYKATELALKMSEEAGVWDRSSGLQGIWGPLIYDWLDQLLPENAVDWVGNGKLSLLVTPVPQFGKDKISSFTSREDLIECNMASVHLPWFLDGNLTTSFRGRPHIDGSFLAKADDYLPNRIKPRCTIRLDWGKDPELQDGEFFDFIKTISADGIWEILERGKAYAEMREGQGYFSHLSKN